jgi:hypothetical protein
MPSLPTPVDFDSVSQVWRLVAAFGLACGLTIRFAVNLFKLSDQFPQINSGVGRGSLRLAAPKSTPVLIGSLHRLSRPQQQGRRSVNPFTLVPAVPSGALRVNAVGGSEGGAVKAKKLDYALAPDIESPAFVPFRANPEDANCRLERVDVFLHRQKL